MMWICLCRFADRSPLWTRMMLGCTYFDMDIVLTCTTVSISLQFQLEPKVQVC